MVKANAKVKSNAKPLEFLKRLTKPDEYEGKGVVSRRVPSAKEKPPQSFVRSSVHWKAPR